MSTLPRLSVVTLTNDPPAQVAAALERVRPIASEIVVAVDERVDPRTLGPLDVVADRVVRAEYEVPFEANLCWLDSLATGDWVLQLDGDDVVGDELLAWLSTPGWDDGITHAYVSYRWCWGSPERVLDQLPWWPNPALRLFRTTPGIRNYPSRTHTGRRVAGAHRLVDVPLYHLDLLVSSLDERRAKVDAYEQERPGHRAEDGWAVNSTSYLPEAMETTPRTILVPEADVRAISEVVEAGRAGGGPGSGSSTRLGLTRDRVVTIAERRAAGPIPADAEVRVLARGTLHAVAGLPKVVFVGVTNRGRVPWRPTDIPPNQVGARVRTADGTIVGAELRAQLPGPVGPGQETLALLEVPASLAPGRFRLEVGLLQEAVAWHDARVEVDLHVEHARRILVGADDGRRDELLASVALRLPDVIPVSSEREHLGDHLRDVSALVLFGPDRDLSRAAERGGIPVVRVDGDVAEAVRQLETMLPAAPRRG